MTGLHKEVAENKQIQTYQTNRLRVYSTKIPKHHKKCLGIFFLINHSKFSYYYWFRGLDLENYWYPFNAFAGAYNKDSHAIFLRSFFILFNTAL